jgi:hypothetical protein
MSTTFRYCGSGGSACGVGLYVPHSPGSSEATREHYDLRAQTGQLGSLCDCSLKRRKRLQNFVQMWPKCNPEFEIAAPVSFGSPLLHQSPPRGAKLRPSPPFFSQGP